LWLKTNALYGRGFRVEPQTLRNRHQVTPYQGEIFRGVVQREFFFCTPEAVRQSLETRARTLFVVYPRG